MFDEVPNADHTRRGALAKTGLSSAADTTMDRLAELATRLLHADAGLVALVDDHRHLFPGQYGLPDDAAARRELPLSRSLIRHVVETGEVLQIDDLEGDPRFADRLTRPLVPANGYLGAPLTDLAGNVLGALCVFTRQARRWSDDDCRTLVDLADTASAQLQARIALTEAERATERVRLMTAASAVLNEILDVDATLSRIVTTVVPALGDRCLILLQLDADRADRRLHLDENGLRAVEATDDEIARIADVDAVLSGQVDQIVRTGDEHRTLAAELWGTDGDSSDGMTVIAPILWTHRVLGVLVVSSWADEAVSDADVGLVRDLGRRAGSALHNAQSYERERATAVALQQNLLPDLPQVDGVEVCASYRPSSKGVEIGGDWYDVLELGERHIGVTIGDVTGHNLIAAAAMGRVIGALRCYALEGRLPSDVLGRLDHLAAHLLADLYATCVYGTARWDDDSGTWRVELANAGHLPPLVHLPDGRVELLTIGADPPIGATTRARSNTVIEVPDGSTLVLYTDGLVERRGQLIDHGIDRLRGALAAVEPNGPLDVCCKELIARLAPDGTDDVAILAVRFAAH